METKKIRRIIIFFMVALAISGITAFPIQWGLEILTAFINWLPFNNDLFDWIRTVQNGIVQSYEIAPYIAYGTDWLAFSHIVIATVFIGPLRDPIKNKWVIEFGLIACLMVFPLALIAGPIRGIPFAWQIADCTFGVVGFITLLYCYALIIQLEQKTTTQIQ
jgi:hypothetical protein